MMETLPYLLNNVLFIILPILCYLLFFSEEETSRYSRILSKFSIFLTIALILTIIFPAVYSDEFYYDLRIVPIMMAVLYGPRLLGVGITLIMLVITLIFQYPDFYPDLGNYIIAVAILFWVKKYYLKAELIAKIMMVTLFYLLISITRGIYLIHIDQSQQLPLLIILSFITWFTILAVLLLIEHMEKQAQLKRELRHIEKVDAVGQLAASVTHEVKNPLTTVKGFLQILYEKDYIKEKDKSYMKISIDELGRAEYIIKNYLSLSKPKENPYGKVDISSVLHDLTNLMSTYKHQHPIQMVTSIEPILFVKGIKYEVQQVLLNIVKNGFEAMNEQGGQLYIKAMRRDPFVVITVKDQGKGIAKEDLKKIGESYFSTKDYGTGLGLSVSFEIVKRMGGRITVHSELGYGTIFTIELPLVDD
ncbi:two-component system, sporulation sensor kinase B [Salinibacillus kushneri]|uniref:histidine kinase n=1 Tax=Salinibacillus kushneri TaxID=237682 RepID=A0A1I0DLS1_9BACI|nr:ATP-binding protein [Salinibacillus kushneri]SET33057.1 two-component system, sporulation sensor kinase B [Salinibacillus kushneri]